MKTLFLIWFLGLGILCQSQEKLGNIEISYSQIKGENILIEAAVNFVPSISYSNEKIMMVFFTKNMNNYYNSLEIQTSLKRENVQFLQLKESGFYEVHLKIPARFDYGNPEVIAVLVHGEDYLLKKSLSVIDGEFYNIDQIFNVLSRSGIKPMTFKTINFGDRY